MSDLCRQRTLERRRQRYRERSAAETPVEKDRRLQNERARGEGGDCWVSRLNAAKEATI